MMLLLTITQLLLLYTSAGCGRISSHSSSSQAQAPVTVHVSSQQASASCNTAAIVRTPHVLPLLASNNNINNMRWLQPCSIDEWRNILRPVLYDVHQWPLPLIDIVIHYLFDNRRLVIFGHNGHNNATIIWSLSCNTIHDIIAMAASSLSSKGHENGTLLFSSHNNEWIKNVSIPTKIKESWYMIDQYHHRIIHGINTLTFIFNDPLLCSSSYTIVVSYDATCDRCIYHYIIGGVLTPNHSADYISAVGTKWYCTNMYVMEHWWCFHHRHRHHQQLQLHRYHYHPRSHHHHHHVSHQLHSSHHHHLHTIIMMNSQPSRRRHHYHY